MDAETLTGERLSDEDPFVAGVPGIDIVKFDGRATAPANPVDGPSADGATPGDWAPAIDADTARDAARYGLDGRTTGAQPVGMIVTNTGAAPLTNVNVSDVTGAGPDVRGLSCDFSPLGGPASATTWAGPLLPGASFTCAGTLTLAAGEEHADTASVTADALVTGVDGKTATVTVRDSDAYHARATALALTGGTVIGVLILVALTGGGLLLFLIGRRRRTVHAIAQ